MSIYQGKQLQVGTLETVAKFLFIKGISTENGGLKRFYGAHQTFASITVSQKNCYRLLSIIFLSETE